MKITFDKTEIINTIAPCMGCVSSKSTFSALEGIWFRAENGKCLITSYDMDKGVRTELETVIEEPGSFIVNASDFFQYIKVMPEGKITLEIEEEKLTAQLYSGNIRFTMKALNGSDFPGIPDLEGEWGFKIEQKVFKELCGHTLRSVAVNDYNHPELCGAYVNVKKNEITMVSCNNFTMAKCDYVNDIKEDMPESFSFLVPGRSLTEIQKLISDDEDEVMTIRPTRKHCMFVIGKLVFFTRLIDMKFIDYNRIINLELPIEVEIDKNALQKSLERVSLISERRSSTSTHSHVNFQFTGDTLKLSSVSLTGKVNDELSCKKNGADIEINFSGRHLLDIITPLDCKTIKLKLKSAGVCMTAEPVDGPEEKKQFYMVLPVRV